jgi:hypothetical protein
MVLLLDAVGVASPLRWRWLLRDEETGAALADHQVDLELGRDELARFADLYRYTRSHAAPDRRVADGARIVADAGAWAGRALLGERIGTAITAAAPVTVRVAIPAALGPAPPWPLELAHVNGGPLAARGDVSFVYDIGSAEDDGASGQRIAGAPKAGVGEALRMLAVFSQPTKTSVLALRRERYALTRLIRRIAARERAAIELRVAQYGVTRERLAEIADSADGWDVLHLSGHGAGGLFLLEQADGSPDPVSPVDLVTLLGPARRRAKLAVLSACESAADITAQTLRLIGLTEQADALEATAGEQRQAQVPGLARALVRELDCGVVAMRYPVTDEFAMEFAEVLYERLLSRGQTADVAVARAAAEAAGPELTAARPAISLGTPGLFGARAAGLTVPVPRAAPRLDPAGQRMAYFPDEPDRFVGRLDAMAEAGAALAAGSGRTSVLLHGMAGGGKTACALELAYRHQDSFAAVAFWQAPTREGEWEGALADLASRLEIQLGGYGLSIAAHVGTPQRLKAFLPRLRRLLENNGVLLVLDNLETLLSPEGTWLDRRWELLIDVLTGHCGESRVIATSRVVPAGFAGSRVVTLPVHALSLDEAAGLARELPNLRGLLHADSGPVRGTAGADIDADRQRVLRVLRVVQGHPKLLELADAVAADPETLDERLGAAEAAADRHELEAFFREGTSGLDPGQFLDTLFAWTAATFAGLREPAQFMAQFIADMDCDHRDLDVIVTSWPEFWRRTGRPDEPAPVPLLDALTDAGLIQREAPQAAGAEGKPDRLAYRMHPGVAAAVDRAGWRAVQACTDAALCVYWVTVAESAEREGEWEEDAGAVVQAGLAAVPYLLRLEQWNAARWRLVQALTRDASAQVASTALPSLRRLAAATGRLEDARYLAMALAKVDSGESERLARRVLAEAVAAEDYAIATGTANSLIFLLRESGRLDAAMEMAERMLEYARAADMGPWTQVAAEVHRIQILTVKGEHDRVVAEGDLLLDRMLRLESPGPSDPMIKWKVHEALFSAILSSEIARGNWKRCLGISTNQQQKLRERGASKIELANARFTDVNILLGLESPEKASKVLDECQPVFEEYADTFMLAAVFDCRAEVERLLGHWQTSAELERTALRFSYVRPDPRQVSAGHGNLAKSLTRSGTDPAEGRAHVLAAALINSLAGRSHASPGLTNLAGQLFGDAACDWSPATAADVVEIAERTDGVRLAELLTTLQPDMTRVAENLAQVMRAVAEAAAGFETLTAKFLSTGEPLAAAVVAACRPGETPPADLVQLLQTSGHAEWDSMAAALMRILNGERDPDALLNNLDEPVRIFLREVLARLQRET